MATWVTLRPTRTDAAQLQSLIRWAASMAGITIGLCNIKELRNLRRKRILVACSSYIILLLGLVVMLYRASPAPASQDILGVGIGRYASESGIAYISGRHLLCTPTAASEPFTSVCKIQIAGKILEIHARQTDPKPLGGKCEAYYDYQPWPCTIGSRHDHVYRFAYIEPPLGQSESQLDVLRLQYFFENLPERVYFPYGVLIVTITTTIAVIASTATVLRSKHFSKVSIILFLVLVGGITFVSTFLGAVQLTTSFWD